MTTATPRLTSAQISRARSTDELVQLAQRLPSPFCHLRTQPIIVHGVTRRAAPSLETVRLELQLARHSAYDSGAAAMDRARVMYQLSELRDAGIVKTLTSGSGSGYLLEAKGFRGERRYSIRELEAFVHGCDAARDL